LNGDFQKSLDAVESAIPTAPNSPVLNICHAHALMFCDRENDARTLYLQYRGEKVGAQHFGESLILQDFAALRQARLTRPLMDEIEQLFGAGQ
jgi:hypothetical protein